MRLIEDWQRSIICLKLADYDYLVKKRSSSCLINPNLDYILNNYLNPDDRVKNPILSFCGVEVINELLEDEDLELGFYHLNYSYKRTKIKKTIGLELEKLDLTKDPKNTELLKIAIENKKTILKHFESERAKERALFERFEEVLVS